MATVGFMTVADNAVAKPAPWAGVSIPVTHFFTSSAITTPYGAGYKITTNGSPDSSYHFIQVQNVPWLVGSAKCAIITGNFTQWDSFGDLAPTRRYIDAYVLSNDMTTVLGKSRLMDERDEIGVWHMRTAFISGLTTGTYVKIGIGKYDAWINDWKLTASMAGVTSSFPNAPAWPHENLGPSSITVHGNSNYVWTELSNDFSFSQNTQFASGIYYHARDPYVTYFGQYTPGDVVGIRYTDVCGQNYQMGSYMGSMTDFGIPDGASYWIVARYDAVIDFGWQSQNTQYIKVNQQVLSLPLYKSGQTYGSGVTTGNNDIGRYYDCWFSYGVRSTPANLLPPIEGGPVYRLRASDIGALITSPTGGAFTGHYDILVWNWTTGLWLMYQMGSPATDYVIPPVYLGDLSHFGFRIYLSGANGLITYNTS
jgi:hypothetical protein